jgi:hypothetical protein
VSSGQSAGAFDVEVNEGKPLTILTALQPKHGVVGYQRATRNGVVHDTWSIGVLYLDIGFGVFIDT